MEDRLAKAIMDLFDWFAEERRDHFETQWRRNYDAFRGRYDSDTLKKWKATEGWGWRSRVFVRLTKTKVISAYNQHQSIVLQHGEIPWDLSPTPIPETARGDFLPPAEAKVRCEAMKKIIRDNLSEGQADRIMDTAVLERAIYGISAIRGPVVKVIRQMRPTFGIPGATGLQFPPEVLAQYGRHQLAVAESRLPVLMQPSIWQCFWDLETPNHQEGQGFIFREMMSRGRFAGLADRQGYDRRAIEAMAESYKTARDDTPDDRGGSEGPVLEKFNQRKRVIGVYEYFGRVSVADLRRDREGQIRGLESVKDLREAEIHCVVAAGPKGKDSVVIKPPTLNPLPYRPVYLAAWESLPGEAGGVGLPENVEDSQSIVNGLVRAMLDNKALASNLLIGIKPDNLSPGQDLTVYPGKVFLTDPGSPSIRDGIEFFSPPDITGDTPVMVEFFSNLMDRESGMNILQEAQQPGSRRTAYELARVTEAGNKMLAGLVRATDEGHIEPAITGFYHYHMMTGRDERIKGDFQVAAKGYQSYVDKARRGQNLLALLQLGLSNELTVRFLKVLPMLQEIFRVNDLDPDEHLFSQQEIDQQAAAMAQQMEAQQLAAAAGAAGAVPGVGNA